MLKVYLVHIAWVAEALLEEGTEEGQVLTVNSAS